MVTVAKVAVLGLAGLCALASLVVSVLFMHSPGTTEVIRNKQGEVAKHSIAEAAMIELGGVEQFVLLRGRDISNPILLVLHGGPGDAGAPQFRYFNAGLEDDFVVVHWDQRGAGRSYDRDAPAGSLTVSRLVADAHELSLLLKQRFPASAIIVAGHSWGSYLGMRLVFEHPDEFAAFVGIGQVADQPESERRGFAWVIRQARERGNDRALRALEAVGPPTNGRYRGGLAGLGAQRKWIREFGGAAHGRGNLGSLVLFAWPILVFPEYRLRDKLRYLEAEAFSMAQLEEPMLDDPPARRMIELKVPVFILQGRFDRQTDFELAQSYFETLEAPHKEFVVFENAAHLVPFEQAAEFQRVLVERVRPWGLWQRARPSVTRPQR